MSTQLGNYSTYVEASFPCSISGSIILEGVKKSIYNRDHLQITPMLWKEDGSKVLGVCESCKSKNISSNISIDYLDLDRTHSKYYTLKYKVNILCSGTYEHLLTIKTILSFCVENISNVI